MTEDNTQYLEELRKRAEDAVKGRLESGRKVSGEEAQEIIHELQVYQTELEMQNESLQKTRSSLDESMRRYFDLFNLAPIGYVTISEDMVIKEANLTFSQMVDSNVKYVLKKKLSSFVTDESQDELYLHVRRMLENRGKQSGEIKLKGTSESEVSIVSITVEEGGEITIRSALFDITERKKAEEAVKESELFSSALNRINAYINSTLDYDELMQRVINEGSKALDAESSLISMREGDYWVARFAHNFPSSILGHLNTEEESPISMLVAKERKAIAIDDAYNDPRANRPNMKAYSARSVLVAPIILKDEVIGIIAFYHNPKNVRFSDAQIDFANKLASSLSLAIENARLFETVSESEARYRGLFENLQELVTLRQFIYDQSGEVIDKVLVDANPAALKALGEGPIDEVKGKRDSEILNPGTATMRLEDIREMRTLGKPITKEVHLDANDRDYLMTTAPLGKDHEITTSVDITEIKRAQRATEEERSRLRTILATLPVGVAIADANGRVVEANDAMRRIWGIKEIAVNGVDQYAEFKGWRPDTGERYKAEDWGLAMALLKGETIIGDVIDIERFDGQRATILNSAAPIMSPDGRLLGAVVTAQDITEQRNEQRALARSNAELQQFAYVASHDLQEPLRMVTAYLGLLNKKFGSELSPQAKEYMSTAVRGSERMRQLIDDLLQFSRIDTQVIPFSTVNMNLVTEKVIDDLHVAITENKASVSIEPLPTVWGDATQLSQVLQNLISNAIKFHGAEAPRVEVSARHRGHEWIIAVKDNGIGIDPKYHENLFKMFQRLHTNEQYPGTGIGLAISKKIVERHGGRIWVESKKGVGSIFFFTIPEEQ